MTWWERATSPLRRVRWRFAGWSTDSDRAFHDVHFAGAAYDPFTPSYPGYLTIRRFADLAEAKIAGARVVMDLGCGPGEITCELARRLPQTRFLGVDHSNAAIIRATAHARALNLRNVTFTAADLEVFDPAEPVDAVLMFDAFHHLLNPAAFIERLRKRSARFFLIEPAGDWKGSWNRRFDLDWLPLSMLRIRDRLEAQLGVVPAAGPPSVEPPAAPHEEPTERRYALADFERFFAPWPVEGTGTIAGLQQYGPLPFASSPVRDRAGDITYELIVNVENLLRETGIDLAAKHWAVYAAADAVPRRLEHAAPGADSPDDVPVQGPYDARYGQYEGPRTGEPGQVFTASIEVSNLGWETWSSAGDMPFLVSYHWLDQAGHTVVGDGIRTPFPGAVKPGETRPVALRVQCPDRPGRYSLAIDVVREKVTWFSEAGVPPLRVLVRIRPR